MVDMIDLEFVFDAINSIAIIVTLILLIMQTRFLRRELGLVQEQSKAAIDDARAASYDGLREMVLKINEVFLQWPEIRKYFYEGVPLNSSDPVYPRAEAAAELILDIMEHMLWQSATFPYLYGTPLRDGKSSIRFAGPGEDGSTFWDNYIIDMFRSSPLLVAYAQKKRRWYLKALIERMERAQRISGQGNDD
jgi:hypothetical protein